MGLVFNQMILYRLKKIQKLNFYFGLPEKPVYSKSVVDSPKSNYVFDPVLQFDLVQHDFIVKNTSNQMLELKKVTACCGSLVETYSPRNTCRQGGCHQDGTLDQSTRR